MVKGIEVILTCPAYWEGSLRLVRLRLRGVALVIFAATASTTVAFGQVVVPPDLVTAEGNEENVFPFNCLGGPPSMRYQQIYLGSDVGAGTIEEIRFRQDGTVGIGFGATITKGVIIQLSSSMTGSPFGTSGGLSLTFADNVGPDVAVVFSGDLELSSAVSAEVPRPFDIVLRLQFPFVFDPVGGANLLFDVTVPTCWTSAWFDAENAVDDSVARVVSPDAVSPTAAFADTWGLVTQFVLTELVFEDSFESGDTSAWSLDER